MNAKKSRGKTKYKSFVTYSCSAAAAAMRILSFLTLFSLGASQMTKEKSPSLAVVMSGLILCRRRRRGEEDESFCEQNPGQTSNESHLLLFFCGITGSYDLQQPQIFSFSYPIS